MKDLLAPYLDDEPGVDYRNGCRGIFPLTARLQPWMHELITEHAAALHESVKRYDSPLNIVHPATFQDNVRSLRKVAEIRDVEFDVFFARKANKCLAFVDAAKEVNAGLDVASLQELDQVFQRSVLQERIICTAAVKCESLLSRCLRSGVVIVLDNDDELNRLMALSERTGIRAKLAIRLGGFQHRGEKLPTRFGWDIEDAARLVRETLPQCRDQIEAVQGIHFHLDGYCPEQRVSGLAQSLEAIDLLSDDGFKPTFIDMGGGLPISYLESADEWEAFWQAHRESVLEARPELTHRRHGLGLVNVDGRLAGSPHVYPFHQRLVRDAWLGQILDSRPDSAATIAEQLRQRGIQLRCEPGRSLLDGCGVTVARVEFTKQHPAGHYYVGLSMNRTQCRTSSDDFLVDPVLVPQQQPVVRDGGPMEGYLVGAYCTESELILLRKLCFGCGVGTGDLILFPNTAGYLMHFMESRSHQLPLAKNLVYTGTSPELWTLDTIDETRIEGQS